MRRLKLSAIFKAKGYGAKHTAQGSNLRISVGPIESRRDMNVFLA